MYCLFNIQKTINNNAKLRLSNFNSSDFRFDQNYDTKRLHWQIKRYQNYDTKKASLAN
uniref:Uncharacterized protein n=1 Tax=Arundo donax TaxID=35708 RepID=A0A0A8XT45_ARUDO